MVKTSEEDDILSKEVNMETTQQNIESVTIDKTLADFAAAIDAAQQQLETTYGFISYRSLPKEKGLIEFTFRAKSKFFEGGENSAEHGIDKENEPKPIVMYKNHIGDFVYGLRQMFEYKLTDALLDGPSIRLNHREVYEYSTKSVSPVKVVLELCIYQGVPYVWLKRLWYRRHNYNDLDHSSKEHNFNRPNPDIDGGEWINCRGGFRFCLKNDKVDTIETWLKQTEAKIKSRQ